LGFNIADYTNINDYSEAAKTAVGGVAKLSKPSFFNVFAGHLPGRKVSFADVSRARLDERKVILNQLLERMRAESNAKRQEILTKLMQTEEDKKPYDVIGKCLEIARRIIRGEKVSAEEMRFLARYFPELLFQALLLREEHKDRDEDEVLSDDDRLMDGAGNSDGGGAIVNVAEAHAPVGNAG